MSKEWSEQDASVRRVDAPFASVGDWGGEILWMWIWMDGFHTLHQWPPYFVELRHVLAKRMRVLTRGGQSTPRSWRAKHTCLLCGHVVGNVVEDSGVRRRCGCCWWWSRAHQKTTNEVQQRRNVCRGSVRETRHIGGDAYN